MMRLLVLLLALLAAPVAAQTPQVSNEPVAFTADEVEYDRERGLVIARGRVEAWQNDRVLRADTFTYDRNTGITTAEGNVQLIEADGQVLFADRVELKDRFRDGVLEGFRGLLAANARVAANGARRSGATVHELSRVVYSSCDLCRDDPTAPPLWQLQARRAVQDKDEQRIQYRDATVRFAGIPVLYTPYLSHPDPATPRASGFLFPTFGLTRFLGSFVSTPYFWAIDGTSDLTVSPTLSTRQLPNVGFEYRKLFNNGQILASGSVGGLNGTDTQGQKEVAGHIFARGRFNLDENWRTGFDLNRASDELYLRTFRYDYRRVLTSQVFLEGFWNTETYARADSRAYQGLRTTDDTRLIPFVVPNITIEQAPRERILGGQLTTDANILGLYREVGSLTQRLATRVRWDRPEVGPIGELWTLKLQGEAIGYQARGQQESPILLPDANGGQGVGNLRAAIDWRWPLVRAAGDYGSQTVEPRVQLVSGPQVGNQSRVPNEDSIDFEFTDANLFALNRFTGRDRQEGGTRVDTAFRAAWDFPNGGLVEGLLGRSFRLDDQVASPYPGSGLEKRNSDYVTRLRFAPVPWIETIARLRLDGDRIEDRRFVDTIGYVGLGKLTLSAGYLYSPPLPYFSNPRPREEVFGGGSLQIGAHWRIGASAGYDLGLDRVVLFQATATYEDECFFLQGRFVQRRAVNPATDSLYAGNTLLLFRLGFKTIGDYTFRAL
jgi:LPS-assembly protein